MALNIAVFLQSGGWKKVKIVNEMSSLSLLLLKGKKSRKLIQIVLTILKNDHFLTLWNEQSVRL